MTQTSTIPGMRSLTADASTEVVAARAANAIGVVQNAYLPIEHETIAAYAQRLRALHAHLTQLMEAVERGLREHPAAALRPAGLVAGRATGTPLPGAAAVAAPLGPMRVPVGMLPGETAQIATLPTTAVARPPVVVEPAPEPFVPRPGVRPEGRRVVAPVRTPGLPGGVVPRGLDRRDGAADRRTAPTERRAGFRDGRPEEERVERRAPTPDRRSGSHDRRWVNDRRRQPAPLEHGGPQLDPTIVFWAVQVVFWIVLVVVVLALLN